MTISKKKNLHNRRNRSNTKGTLTIGGKKTLPGFKGKRSADGKKKISKVAKNKLTDALPVEIFTKPIVRDAAKAPSHDDPPLFLNADGLYMWQTAGRAVAKVGELNSDHLSGLTALAYLHQRIWDKMKRQMDVPHQDQRHYLSYLIQYGLTPISGQALDPENKRRVKPTPFVEPEPEDSPSDSFKELMGKRRGAQ